MLGFYCCTAHRLWVNYSLRVVQPKLTDAFAARCVNAQGSEPALISGPQFHVLGCRESAIHQGVAQRHFAGSVLVQLGGLFGDVADMIVTEMGQADAGLHVGGASTRGDGSCACASVQHDNMTTFLSARTSFVTRRPDASPLHVLPCEPGSPGSTLLRSGCCCRVTSGLFCLLPPVTARVAFHLPLVAIAEKQAPGCPPT